MNLSAATAALIGFVAVLGAYLALVLTGHSPDGLIGVVVTVAGILGLGLHNEARTREQNAEIGQIKAQTNGVLDGRIRDGSKVAMAEVLAEHGLTRDQREATAAKVAALVPVLPAQVDVTILPPEAAPTA